MGPQERFAGVLEGGNEAVIALQRSSSWLWSESEAECLPVRSSLPRIPLRHVPLLCQAASRGDKARPHPQQMQRQQPYGDFNRLAMSCSLSCTSLLPGFPCQRPPFHPRPYSGELASKSPFQTFILRASHSSEWSNPSNVPLIS